MSARDARPMPARPAEPPRDERDAAAPAPRRAYHTPRLESLGTADELLEVLGPAQASYGMMGP